MTQGAELPSKDQRTLHRQMVRAAALFVNFFLIVSTLYLLKPASRSIILESHTSIDLPWIWIGSAAVIMLLMPLYRFLLCRFGRDVVVPGTLGMFSLLLIVFWWALKAPTPAISVAFYILVDILGVMLVEQAWSLTNSLYDTRSAKSWYGIVGTGGLIGGFAGSAISGMLIDMTPLKTPDLLLVASAVLVVVLELTLWMQRSGVARARTTDAPVLAFGKGVSALVQNPYLLLIAGGLLLAQLVSPIIEYQFMSMVEAEVIGREERTALLSNFFTLLSMVSIVVNLALTPLILRKGGILAGLIVQPLCMLGAVLLFSNVPAMWSASLLKISDRGLAYSLTRAAREMLYIPIHPDQIYEAKAWIDMFGYRIFKVLGAGLILLLTPAANAMAHLNAVVALACVVWAFMLLSLYREYRRVRSPITI